MKQKPSNEKGFKSHLPTKTCPICNRLFSWRKKWRLNWDSVVYCSDRCRKDAKRKSK